MPTKYRFVTDGAFVNFYDDDSLTLRLHNSSRHVQWNFKDESGVHFNIDEIRYDVELDTISFDGQGISEQSQFEDKIIRLFPGLAGSDGGDPGSTPGIDDVLAVGQALTASRQVEMGGYSFAFRVNDDNLFEVDGSGKASLLQAHLGVIQSEVILNADIDDENVRFRLVSTDNVNEVKIEGNPISDSITHTADTHTFNGKIELGTGGQIILTGIPEFADNAAALSGGVPVRGLYFSTVSGDFVLKMAND